MFMLWIKNQIAKMNISPNKIHSQSNGTLQIKKHNKKLLWN